MPSHGVTMMVPAVWCPPGWILWSLLALSWILWLTWVWAGFPNTILSEAWFFCLWKWKNMDLKHVLYLKKTCVWERFSDPWKHDWLKEGNTLMMQIWSFLVWEVIGVKGCLARWKPDGRVAVNLSSMKSMGGFCCSPVAKKHTLRKSSIASEKYLKKYWLEGYFSVEMVPFQGIC